MKNPLTTAVNMALKAGVLLVVMVGWATPALTQERVDKVWQLGTLLTKGGDTLELEFMVTYDNNIALVRQGDKSVAFNARQVNYLTFRDQETGLNRYVFSLPYSPTPSGYKVPQLFELEYETENLALLSRERIVNDADLAWNPYTGTSMGRPVQRLVKEHYMRRADGYVFQVKSKKKDMLAALPAYKEEMKEYLDQNSLDVYDSVSLRKFIDQYNLLCETAKAQTNIDQRQAHSVR